MRCILILQARRWAVSNVTGASVGQNGIEEVATGFVCKPSTHPCKISLMLCVVKVWVEPVARSCRCFWRELGQIDRGQNPGNTECIEIGMQFFDVNVMIVQPN